MTFLDRLKDGLSAIVPDKRGRPPMSTSLSGGIGSGNGVVGFEDDVRHFLNFLISPIVLSLYIVTVHFFWLRGTTVMTSLCIRILVRARLSRTVCVT